jgi:hypothetical protein
MGLIQRLKNFFKGSRPRMATEKAKDPKRPVVLVHGYSDQGKSFVPWARELRKAGFETETIAVVTYKSLTNEVTIKDLAEGFERALVRRGIKGPFDAIVHSTGMLVVRAWLTADRDNLSRRDRLRHLIGFAPATWGSPLAHRGRGLLGSVFKGNKSRDPVDTPDFLEAGDLILDGLELGSRFTWDLANVDLFGKDVFYGTQSNTPYPFIFCGNKPYSGLRKLVNEPGTDGTVRFAGVSLDSRKFSVDLTKPEGAMRLVPATREGREAQVDAPVIFVDGRTHGSIVSEPDPDAVNLVIRALNVSSHDEYLAWRKAATDWSQPPTDKEDVYQQFVIHMIDERGDGISDYHVELFSSDVGGRTNDLEEFDLDMHEYQADKSFRSFHVQVRKLIDKASEIRASGGKLWMRVTISSGTILVAYHGNSDAGFPGARQRRLTDDKWTDNDSERTLDAEPTLIHLDLTEFLDISSNRTNLFHAFTTTLVEIKVDREPLPFGSALARLCQLEDLGQLGV